MRRRPRLAATTAALCLAWSAGPGRAEDDKSQYWLFNPTPDAKLRDFNPDRPGQSHDPTTIDAGRVVVETGLYEHVFDPRGPSATTTRRYIFPNPNLRVGVTDTIDIEISTPLANLLRPGLDDRFRASGIGDSVIGAKMNLLGNENDGDHLLAVLPNVKIPTASRGVGNGFAEYLLSVPYNYKLATDLVLTLEPSVGALRNTANTRYRDSYGFIVGLDQTIAKVVVASIEVSSQVTSDRRERTTWAVSPSLAYFVTKNVQLDVGAVLGLNKATPRYDPYLGVSMRF